MAEATMKSPSPIRIDPRFRRVMQKIRRRALNPPPQLTVPEWADKYRRLSASAGAIGGPWRTSRVEIARGPMLAVKEPGVRTITVKTCTQMLKTSLLENILGYHAHLDPCPMLLTQAKETAVKAFSKERLAPMARATPVLRDILGNDRQRGGSDTLGYKEFPGGFLAMESAGSPTNLAMRAIRITLLDEIDKYEGTKEGDPVILAEERTATFAHNSLHVRACSPTWEETSRIDKSYKESDQRLPFVACPHCNYEQVLTFFKHVHWGKSEEGEHFPFTAAIYCEDCGAEWSEAQRMKILTTEGAIKWRQTRPFIHCDVRQEPLTTRKWLWNKRYQIGYALCTECGERAVPNTHAGFTAGKLHSPFITIPELASKWILSKDDPETKQTFYNTQLGLAYHAQALRKIEAHALLTRREVFTGVVPMAGLVLTAGVDVQPGSKVSEGRLECEVVAWGLGEESWSMETKVFIGDPAKAKVWAELDNYLLKTWDHESGAKMIVRAACIDSGGHNTNEVYNFARARIGRNVWAVKGAADRGGQWSPVWPIPKFESKRTRRTGYKPVIIGVNAAKEAIRQRLLIEEIGPGFCHFPEDRPEGWFEQLTSERLIIEKKGGFTSRKWDLPKGRANEALDCRVYAYAALCGLYARKLNLENIAELIAKQLSAAVIPAPLAPDTEEVPPAPAPVVALVSPAPSAPQRRVRRSKWMA